VAIRLNNVGRVEGKLGDWVGAYRRHLEALDINEAAYGPSHPDVAGTHYHLGLAALRREDAGAARDHFARALSVARRFFDESHPFCALVRGALSSAHEAEQDTAAVGRALIQAPTNITERNH
jgi:Tfp pilus assembly protein PilF